VSGHKKLVVNRSHITGVAI